MICFADIENIVYASINKVTGEKDNINDFFHFVKTLRSAFHIDEMFIWLGG